MKIWFFIVVLLLCPAIAKADVAVMPWQIKLPSKHPPFPGAIIDKTCPDEAPLMGTDGECYPCDEQAVEVVYGCSLCPDMHSLESPLHVNNYTFHMCIPPTWRVPSSGTCPAERPLQGEDGYCYPSKLEHSVFGIFPHPQIFRRSQD